MSNKDINNQDASKNISEVNSKMIDNMHLFSLSLLKSKAKLTLSQNNSFNYDFSKENTEPNYVKAKDSPNKINNRKISLIDDDNNSSLKTLNIEVPSAEKLTKESFKNEFMKEYENSFAHYCGINKDQFTDIYINNRYTPVLDEFGDINISIKHIVELLKTYSFNMKAGRKILKHNRIKKYFKTQKKKTIERRKTKHLFEVLNTAQKMKKQEMKKLNFDTKSINDSKKKEIINIKENENNKLDDIKKESYNQISSLITIKKNNENNNNYHPSGSRINSIKNRLIQNKGFIYIPDNKALNQKQQLSKLSGFPINTSSSFGFLQKPSLNNISNNSYLFNNNNLSNEINKKQILNNINNNPTSLGLGYSAIQSIQDTKQNIVSPNNNNFFNFSNQNLKYTSLANTNNINTNILNNNTANNLNYNQINNQLLSPNLNNPISSPRILLNEIFSPFSPFSNLQTPRIISPNFNNNNIFQDRFTYNNINGNSFFFGNNSPVTINNNNNININNNIINNNIINNKKNNNYNGNIINNNPIDSNITNNRNVIEKNNNNILNNNNNTNNNNILNKNLNNNLKN